MNNIEEREFKTTIIATILENYICGEFEIGEISDFASFVLGMHIRYGDLHDYKYMIIKKIYDEYPELKNNRQLDGDMDYSFNMKLIKLRYLDKYGEYMKFHGITIEENKQKKLLKRKNTK